MRAAVVMRALVNSVDEGGGGSGAVARLAERGFRASIGESEALHASLSGLGRMAPTI